MTTTKNFIPRQDDEFMRRCFYAGGKILLKNKNENIFGNAEQFCFSQKRFYVIMLFVVWFLTIF
jgi:hypothetical protein